MLKNAVSSSPCLFSFCPGIFCITPGPPGLSLCSSNVAYMEAGAWAGTEPPSLQLCGGGHGKRQ